MRPLSVPVVLCDPEMPIGGSLGKMTPWRLLDTPPSMPADVWPPLTVVSPAVLLAQPPSRRIKDIPAKPIGDLMQSN